MNIVASTSIVVMTDLAHSVQLLCKGTNGGRGGAGGIKGTSGSGWQSATRFVWFVWFGLDRVMSGFGNLEKNGRHNNWGLFIFKV